MKWIPVGEEEEQNSASQHSVKKKQESVIAVAIFENDSKHLHQLGAH